MITTNSSNCSSPVIDSLRQLHQTHASCTEGKVATYIPELAKADPNWFSICLVTVNGAVYEVGDSAQPFTIQSISKPFVYGLALEDNGRGPVLEKVGVEPTGDAFNSISLDPETGHRNRAIGHMLRNFNMLESDPMPVVDLYFKQCSVSVNGRDLGIMAATLANRGVNPVTGKQAIRGEYVESVLSAMGSCGMYDYAGEWIYNVGMPAKSGVSGGIIAVLPGQLGVGVFSPPLDARGNSVRGIRVCQDLSRHLDLHLFNRPSIGRFTIRTKFSGGEVNSSRVRTQEEIRALRESGRGIKVYQLQGNLNFTTTEVVVHDLIEAVESIDHLIIDLKRVLSINESACHLLLEVLRKLSDLGKPVLFAHADRTPLLRRFMKAKLGPRFEELFRGFDDLDPAMEWCENRLLEKTLPGWSLDRTVRHERYELFDSFTEGEVALVTALFERRRYQPGETVINLGDAARELFFIARGSVSVTISLPTGTAKRLATFSAGMAFGEMALIDGAPRSARIVADSEVECDLLTREDFERLGRAHPEIKIKLLENLCLGFCRNLRKANRQMSVLD